jgi:hypothetical protein
LASANWRIHDCTFWRLLFLSIKHVFLDSVWNQAHERWILVILRILILELVLIYNWINIFVALSWHIIISIIILIVDRLWNSHLTSIFWLRNNLLDKMLHRISVIVTFVIWTEIKILIFFSSKILFRIALVIVIVIIPLCCSVIVHITIHLWLLIRGWRIFLLWFKFWGVVPQIVVACFVWVLFQWRICGQLTKQRV